MNRPKDSEIVELAKRWAIAYAEALADIQRVQNNSFSMPSFYQQKDLEFAFTQGYYRALEEAKL